MSESNKFPASILSAAFFGALGVTLTAVCLAGAAQWMVLQGCSGTAASLLATAAVCLGGFFSALASALWKRQHGLVNGLLQGALLAGILTGTAMFSGTGSDPLLLARMAAVTLCGGVGGLLGVSFRERRHALH